MENTITQQKPTKPKPHFYAVCFPSMQQIAKDLGYNLVIHGSMNRDLDLVAIPWTDTPASHYELLSKLDMDVNGKSYDEDCFERGYMFSILPGQRSSYVININRTGKYNGLEESWHDAQYYIDISITPLPQT